MLLNHSGRLCILQDEQEQSSVKIKSNFTLPSLCLDHQSVTKHTRHKLIQRVTKRMNDKYVHIRYLAVRDKDDNFLGVLEFTQDIAPIKALEGEKRLVTEE